jgi:hypothetical protein
MRYRGLQFIGMLFTAAACAGAQAAPPPAPSPVEQERAAAERQRELTRELAEVTRQRVAAARAQAGVARERAQATVRERMSDSALLNRATLGVTLSQTGNRRDTLGIFISAVAPDGPAERAGVVEGDRIAAINGVDVRTQASDAGDAYLAGVAQRRFTLELRKLTPGQRANLRVWSGGRYRDVQVTLGRYSEVYRNRRTQIRIGGNNLMPGFAPNVHVVPHMPAAPLTPGRILMPAPMVRPLPRGGRVEVEDIEGAVVASVEAMDLSATLAPLAELGAMFEDELFDAPLEFDTGIELDLEFDEDDLAPFDVEASTEEAIRQAHETLAGLERRVSSM